jgi:hypothetical protein
MKKYIFLIVLMLFCQNANAGFILKYGLVASDTNVDGVGIENVGTSDTITWAGIWGETDDCKYCIALFAIETYKDDTNNPHDRMVGIDYVIKAVENDDGVIRSNFGFGVSDDPLQGGEVFNFHFGLSMTAKNCFYKISCSINYDHFSNGNKLFNRKDILVNIPLDLLSIGIGF